MSRGAKAGLVIALVAQAAELNANYRSNPIEDLSVVERYAVDLGFLYGTAMMVVVTAGYPVTGDLVEATAGTIDAGAVALGATAVVP